MIKRQFCLDKHIFGHYFGKVHYNVMDFWRKKADNENMRLVYRELKGAIYGN